MKFNAMCTASVSKNGAHVVLLKFEPPVETGHLMGDIPKELGALERDIVYEITIVKKPAGNDFSETVLTGP